MNSHSHDTVWITPGECYTVYDPGGVGDYYPNDTSTLVIISTTGLGFRLHGYVEMSDLLSFNSDGTGGESLWGEVDNYYPEGIAYLTLISDEDSNSSGFAFHISFYPTIHSLDTLWQTDTTMAITWQDTSAASRWTVTYGTNIDSLRTTTTITNQVILTGLGAGLGYALYSIFGRFAIDRGYDSYTISFYNFNNKKIFNYERTIQKVKSHEKCQIKIDFLNNRYLILEDNSTITRKHTLLDYLHAGVKIALTIGIDFSNSNNNSYNNGNLHSIQGNTLNYYERAITACAHIVGFYDFDQLFPVWYCLFRLLLFHNQILSRSHRIR